MSDSVAFALTLLVAGAAMHTTRRALANTADQLVGGAHGSRTPAQQARANAKRAQRNAREARRRAEQERAVREGADPEAVEALRVVQEAEEAEEARARRQEAEQKVQDAEQVLQDAVKDAADAKKATADFCADHVRNTFELLSLGAPTPHDTQKYVDITIGMIKGKEDIDLPALIKNEFATSPRSWITRCTVCGIENTDGPPTFFRPIRLTNAMYPERVPLCHASACQDTFEQHVRKLQEKGAIAPEGHHGELSTIQFNLLVRTVGGPAIFVHRFWSPLGPAQRLLAPGDVDTGDIGLEVPHGSFLNLIALTQMADEDLPPDQRQVLEQAGVQIFKLQMLTNRDMAIEVAYVHFIDDAGRKIGCGDEYSYHPDRGEDGSTADKDPKDEDGKDSTGDKDPKGDKHDKDDKDGEEIWPLLWPVLPGGQFGKVTTLVVNSQTIMTKKDILQSLPHRAWDSHLESGVQTTRAFPVRSNAHMYYTFCPVPLDMTQLDPELANGRNTYGARYVGKPYMARQHMENVALLTRRVRRSESSTSNNSPDIDIVD